MALYWEGILQGWVRQPRAAVWQGHDVSTALTGMHSSRMCTVRSSRRGGISARRDICPGGVCTELSGGWVSACGCLPQCMLGYIPPWTEWQTPWKHNLSATTAADGNQGVLHGCAQIIAMCTNRMHGSVQCNFSSPWLNLSRNLLFFKKLFQQKLHTPVSNK